jgi:hypothetical protein
MNIIGEVSAIMQEKSGSKNKKTEADKSDDNGQPNA